MKDSGIKRGLRLLRERAAASRKREQPRRCEGCEENYYASHDAQRCCSRKCVGSARRKRG